MPSTHSRRINVKVNLHATALGPKTIESYLPFP
jgi:hypothetical protein